MRLNLFFLSLILLLSFSPVSKVIAQDQPSGPVYVVQTGDTFYSIAVKFGVTVDDLVSANPQVDPNMLSIGAEVVIPGLEGVNGRLETQTIQLGETMRTLSIRNQINTAQLSSLNRLTSPAEVYAGATLVIPQKETSNPMVGRFLLAENNSLFQEAVPAKSNPWLVAEINQSTSTWNILPGEVLYYPSEENAENTQLNVISPVVNDLSISPLPAEQGETTTIKITTTQPVELSGSLAGNELRFFATSQNEYVALQGIHAMQSPGIYPFTITGKLADGSLFSFEQMIVVQALGYIQESIQGVDEATIDPAVTKPEDEQIKSIVASASPEKMWDGLFICPGYDPTWLTSTYGNRRSYNGGPYSYFHTGVDYGGGTGLPIYAPAAGVVVFAGPLTVRGNATIIDHGWGVYSGFWHQSEIQVQVDDRVEPGQVIGLVGGTGRVTGAHLHWEIWVNGNQINPLTWLEQSFP